MMATTWPRLSLPEPFILFWSKPGSGTSATREQFYAVGFWNYPLGFLDKGSPLRFYFIAEAQIGSPIFLRSLIRSPEMGDSQYSFSLTTFRYAVASHLSFSRLYMLQNPLQFYLHDFGYIFLHLLLHLSVRSPSGKLVQIEHALMAVGSGQTSLGIKGEIH